MAFSKELSAAKGLPIQQNPPSFLFFNLVALGGMVLVWYHYGFPIALLTFVAILLASEKQLAWYFFSMFRIN